MSLESGAGQVVKACNQIKAAAQMVPLSELLVLARKGPHYCRTVVSRSNTQATLTDALLGVHDITDIVQMPRTLPRCSLVELLA